MCLTEIDNVVVNETVPDCNVILNENAGEIVIENVEEIAVDNACGIVVGNASLTEQTGAISEGNVKFQRNLLFSLLFQQFCV